MLSRLAVYQAVEATLARKLAQRLTAVYLRIDTIEQALKSSDVLRNDVGPAGYITAYKLAEERNACRHLSPG